MTHGCTPGSLDKEVKQCALVTALRVTFPLSAFETLPAVCGCRRHVSGQKWAEVKRVPVGLAGGTCAALTALTVRLSPSHLSRPLVQNKDVRPSLSLVLKEVEF